MKGVVIVSWLLVLGCGRFTPRLETEHEVETTSTIDVKTESTVKTDLDTLFRICEIKTDEEVVPYREWTEEQKECLTLVGFWPIDKYKEEDLP